jgi:hypothetical protein
MSIGPDAPADGVEGVGPGEADRVLLLAMRAWAPAGRAGMGDRSDGHPHARLLGRLEGSWAGRVLAGRGDVTTETGDRAEARERLGEAHRAEARIDLARVHPSWLVRGLREESPSVRRAVVAAAPEPIRSRVQEELLLDNDDLRGERPADAEVLAWACSLSTERLVGGEPQRADDPPVIVAIAGLSARDGYRLCRYAGEIKMAMAGQRRAEWADACAATAGPEFAVIARHDVKSTPAAKVPPRRLPARIGLLTIARLLADCEPFRARWALQHWPYAIAKLVRAVTPPDAKRSPVMMRVEAEVLKFARDRVRLLGR